MKPTLLPFLILFFFACTVSAQTKPEVLNYYKTVNLAELAICDSNFTEANKHYKDAFAINKDKPFSKDLLNAFYAAMDTKKYTLAEKYMARMLSRGIGVKFIENNLYKNYKGEQLQQLKEIIARHPNKSFGTNPLRTELNKMIHWDKNVRMHFAELYDGAYMVDSTYYVDYTNGSKLYNMFLANGVPNEDVIGNAGRKNPSPGVDPDFSIIIIHYTMASERFPHIAFDTLLYNAINSFDFDIRVYAKIIHREAINSSFRYHDLTLNLPILLDGFEYQRKIYPSYWTDISEREINTERAKIGLEPLDDFRRKLATSNKGKYTMLGKYDLSVSMSYVIVTDTLEHLHKFLTENCKGCANKRSLAKARARHSDYKIDYGHTYDRVINKTNLDSVLAHPEVKGWLQRPIVFQNWTDRKSPLKWGQHAEVLRNPKANISTDTGRYNQAKFLRGYRIYASACTYSGGSVEFTNEESIFENNLLINFTADVDSGFYRYKGVIRALGKPVFTQISDTLKDGTNRILKTKRYTWQKGYNRTRHTISEYYNTAGQKRVYSVYEMSDVKKYTAYLEKVETEKKRLEKQFLAGKK